MESQATKIVRNALLLTVSTLFMRTVGVGFQVYLSNRVGAEAMGLFSLLGGVYGFALTFATSGIYIGVTHLVVSAIGEKQPERIHSVMKKACLYALSFGTAAALLLFCFAKQIGIYWLHDERTIPSLRLIGTTLPLIALSSAFTGYFSAVRRIYKNAFVNLFEQGAKIFLTTRILAFFIAKDAKSVLLSIVLGGVLSEIASFLLELILFLKDRKKHFQDPFRSVENHEGRKLIRISMPIALSAYIRSGLITLEHILIPHGLRKSGVTHALALSAYGQIQSMALPIVLYPAALISSFSGLLIPEFSESRVKREKIHIQYMFSRVFSLTALFSIGVAGILFCFSEELGNALYPGTEAARYIRLLSPLIPVMYIDTSTDAMLKGMGEQLYSMKVNIADAAISVILVMLLVPKFGIDGYLITIYLSETFNTSMSILRLLQISKAKVQIFKWIYKPLFCVIGATSLAKLLFSFLRIDRIGENLTITVHIATAACAYLILMQLCGGITEEDRIWICGIFKRQKNSAEPICRSAEKRLQKESS